MRRPIRRSVARADPQSRRARREGRRWSVGVAALAFALTACQGGYPLAPTRCDEWCDATKDRQCGNYYDPANCVSACEAEGTVSNPDCRDEFDAALTCYRGKTEQELCPGFTMAFPPCALETQTLATCGQVPHLHCGVASSCEDRSVPGLVAWYSFEAEDGPVQDAAGCDDPGTLSGLSAGMRCQEGFVGKAFQFGTGAVVSVPSSPAFADLRQLSVQAAVWLDGSSGGPVISHGDGQAGDNFSFSVFSQRLALNVGNAFGAAFPALCSGMTGVVDPSPSLLPTGSWVQIAVVVDDESKLAHFYVDGSLTSSVLIPNGVICATQAPLWIGSPTRIGNLPFFGRIDELKLWNVARSAADICSDAGGTFDAGRCLR